MASSNLAHLVTKLNMGDLVDGITLADKLYSQCLAIAKSKIKQQPRVLQEVLTICELIRVELHDVTTEYSNLAFSWYRDPLPDEVLDNVLKNKDGHLMSSVVGQQNSLRPNGNITLNKRNRRNLTTAGIRRNLTTAKHPPKLHSEIWDIVKLLSTKKQKTSGTGNNKEQRIEENRILAVLAGMFAGWAGNSLFSMLSSSKVNELVKATNSLSSAQQHLVHAIQANSKEIAWNRRNIASLTKTLHSFEKALQNMHIEINVLIAEQYAKSLINSIRHRLALFRQAVTSASNERLAPGLLTSGAANRSLEQITLMAKAKGLEPLINDSQLFYSLPTSFVFSGSVLNIITHVFLAEASQAFNLFAYRSFPIRVGDEIEVLIEPRKPLLALSASGTPEVKSLGLYIELDEHDIAACYSFNNLLVCPQLVVFRKKTYQTCVFALYYSTHQDVAEKCSVYIRKSEPTSIALKPNKFLAVTNSSTYSYYCYANKTYLDGFQLKQTSILNVPENCYLDLQEFRLSSQTNLYLSSELKTFDWTLSHDDLFHDMTLDDVHQSMNALAQISHHEPIALAHLRAYKAQITPLSYSRFLGYTAATLGIAALILLLVFIAYSVYSAKKKARDYNLQREKDRIALQQMIPAPGSGEST